MIRAFDRSYSRLIYFGLIALIWFGAFFRAAHDLWAASVLFGGITLLAGTFCVGRLRDRKPVHLPLGVSLSLFLLALGFSLWRSYDLESTWLELWGWTFCLIAFYLFLNITEDLQDAERFFVYSGAVVVPLALIGAWQIFPHIPEEVSATLINSIVLAGFILYWCLFFMKKTLEDPRYWIALAACLVTLAFARSWSAFAALFIGWIFWRYKKIPSVVLLLSGIALGLALYFKLQSSLQPSSRLCYWESAIRMWQHVPWTGVGLGGFATAYPYFKIGSVENTRYVHSFPLQLLAETGIAGAAALAFLVVRFFRYEPGDKKPRSGGSVYRVTLVMILAFSLVSINMDYLLNKLLFFLFLGTALMPLSTKAFPVRPLWVATGGVGLLFLSAFWLNLFAASRLYTSGLAEEQRGNMAQAEHLYREAIALESFHADSYWRLFQIYFSKYKKDHAPETLAAAKAHLRQAVRYRKDIRFLQPSTKE